MTPVYQSTACADLPLAAFSVANSSLRWARLISSLRIRSHLVLPGRSRVADRLGRTRSAGLRTLLAARVLVTCCLVSVCISPEAATGCREARMLGMRVLAMIVSSCLDRLQDAVVQPWGTCGQGVVRVWWQRGVPVGVPK